MYILWKEAGENELVEMILACMGRAKTSVDTDVSGMVGKQKGLCRAHRTM